MTHHELPALAEKKRLCIFGVEFVYLYFFGILVAAVGWWVENLARAFGAPATFDCRYHLLPFISVYGLIVFAFHIALGDPDRITLFGKRLFKQDTWKTRVLSNIFSFLLISLFVFLGELAVGNLWDILFGVQLWNYGGWPLRVTQYTSIVSTFGFGFGAYLLFRFVYKPVLRLCRKINFKVAKIVDCTLGVLIVLDTLFMIVWLTIFHESPMYWSVKLK